MTMFLFIAPYDLFNPHGSNLRIDVADYRHALMEQWPDLSIIDHSNPVYHFVWEFKTECVGFQSQLRCFLYNYDHVYYELDPAESAGIDSFFVRTRNGIAFNQPDHRLFRHILWHRAYIPLRYPLFLSLSHSVEQSFPLTATTTASAMMEYMCDQSQSMLSDDRR